MTSTYNANGIVYDRFADIKSGVEASIVADLGESINLDKDSLYGHVAEIIAYGEAVANEIGQKVFDAGTIENSDGATLDGNVAHVGIERTGESYSTISQIRLTAAKACTVPAGTRYRTANNVVFATDVALVFTGAGTNTVAGTCTVSGGINVAIGELVQIVNPINGITAVTNMTAAVPGTLRQTDAELKASHTLFTATSGEDDSAGIYEALYAIPVDKARIIDNDSDQVSVEDGATPAHTIRVIVLGGTDEDVARAIWFNKTTGVQTYGAQAVNVYNETFGNSKTIKFDRGTENSTVVNVYYRKLSAFPLDGDRTIQETIAAIFDSYNFGSVVNYEHIRGSCYAVPGIELRAPYLTLADEYTEAQTESIANGILTRPVLDIVRNDAGVIIASNIVMNEV